MSFPINNVSGLISTIKRHQVKLKDGSVSITCLSYKHEGKGHMLAPSAGEVELGRSLELAE